SILAKKKAASATHVLIDIPVGKGAKIEDMQHARMLKTKFERIGKLLGMHVVVCITDGSEPIGSGIGPALEAKDILYTLAKDKRGSQQLYEKSVQMAGILLEMGKKASKGKGEQLARQLVDSGQAYQKFIDIIKAQGAYHTHA